MKKVIYKYACEHRFLKDGIYFLPMPKDAQILHVAVQSGALVLWALVSQEDYLLPRKIRVVPTGTLFDPTGAKHIGSFQDDWFVGHVFDLGSP